MRHTWPFVPSQPNRPTGVIVTEVSNVSGTLGSPEEGEFSHMDRLIGLGDLIVLLEDAQPVLREWAARAFDGGWWRPEFEQWTVGTPGHGGLTIWLG